MRTVFASLLAGSLVAGAAATPGFAADRLQGGLSKAPELVFSQRTMRQQALLNDMRRLRAEIKAAKAGGAAEDQLAAMRSQLTVLQAEYVKAG